MDERKIINFILAEKNNTSKQEIKVAGNNG